MTESSSYNKAFNYMLGHEIWPDGRAFVNDPDDPGGVTNFGISHRAHGKDLPNWFFSKPANEQEYADQKKIARHFYWQRYWDEQWEHLDQRVAAKVFDLSVNMGITSAVKLLQAALNALLEEGEPPLKVDGIYGPKTHGLAAGEPPMALPPSLLLCRELGYEAAARYLSIIEADKRSGDHSRLKFLPGWLGRALEIPRLDSDAGS